ncbi:MAG TPA: IgGFc-binding protein, partial [Candidatus Thermoplasmatota archaeon]|nr:IgGFc-binding protein [Candidatus Thermoplasmatota archaeon]
MPHQRSDLGTAAWIVDTPAAATGASRQSFVTVVAPEAATVTVRPTADILAGPGVLPLLAGTSQTFSLGPYDTLQLASLGDLTGTRVTSSRPVAVYSGSSNATLLGAWGAVAETVPAARHAGTEHLLCPSTRDRPYDDVDWVRVVAIEPGVTRVTFELPDGTLPSAELTQGASAQRVFGGSMDGPVLVRSTAPVMVARAWTDLDAADTRTRLAFTYVLPVHRWNTTVGMYTPGGDVDAPVQQDYAVIAAREGASLGWSSSSTAPRGPFFW